VIAVGTPAHVLVERHLSEGLGLTVDHDAGDVDRGRKANHGGGGSHLAGAERFEQDRLGLENGHGGLCDGEGDPGDEREECEGERATYLHAKTSGERAAWAALALPPW
jgi:hypothetical protein